MKEKMKNLRHSKAQATLVSLEKFFIRRGLRALEDREFPLPSNTVGIVGMCKELFADVAEIVPPLKKFKIQKKNWFKICF